MYWTEEKVLGAIQLWAQENGRSPRCVDFDTDDQRFPYPSAVQQRFGTWNAAIQAAGLEARPAGWPKGRA